jgi:hypothetical protein
MMYRTSIRSEDVNRDPWLGRNIVQESIAQDKLPQQSIMYYRTDPSSPDCTTLRNLRPRDNECEWDARQKTEMHTGGVDAD